MNKQQQRRRSGEDTRPRYSMTRPDAQELLAWLRCEDREVDEAALVRVDRAMASPITVMPKHEDMRVLLALELAEVSLVRQVLADDEDAIDDGGRLDVIAKRLEKQIERSKRYEQPAGRDPERRARARRNESR